MLVWLRIPGKDQQWLHGKETMAKYELTDKQVQNLKALIMDSNIKGAVAPVIVELVRALENPVVEVKEDDLHGKHHDRIENMEEQSQKDGNSCH